MLVQSWLRNREIAPSLIKGLDTPGLATGMGIVARDWPMLIRASVALVRLDERVAMAAEPVKAGWFSRALYHEATASLRLEGSYVTPQDLMLVQKGGLDRAGDQALARANGIHSMLLAMTRRN